MEIAESRKLELDEGLSAFEYIDNEYGNVEWAYSAAAKPYVNWVASMAVSLETGMPWVQQAYDFTPSSPRRSAPHRTPRDDFPTTDPTEEDTYEDEYDDDAELNMYHVQGTLREWVTRDESEPQHSIESVALAEVPTPPPSLEIVRFVAEAVFAMMNA
ncbi:Beta-galactosidase 6 [Platanthera zijinensis]|uniref:Beta-galactosidase 6 n=1 Tax=Platanthera zijinensis TaxID=2320716 RepID=A0AAP0G9B8_9ASPA